jgi:hypothetical protein
MLVYHKRQTDFNYQGTIIDIETIGDYVAHVFPQYDSREFKNIKVVIFGYINKDGYHIYCAEGVDELPKLKEFVMPIIDKIEHPLYALNCHHEMGTIFHDYGIKLVFDKELQARDYERKEDALLAMGIDPKTFNDPFQNKRSGGLACKIAWESGQYNLCLQHNRACLLKEQALMLKGRGRPIIPFTFSEVENG